MRTTHNTETHEWLLARGRDGVRRIEKLGWPRLARIYRTHRPNSPIRRAINAECRRRQGRRGQGRRGQGRRG